MVTPITFSQHAEAMLAERLIKREWVERTIAEPEALEVDPTRPNVFRAFRRIPEHGDRYLRVAYVQVGDRLKVVTVFFDRGMQRRQRT
jgi:hypothetical protein